MEKLYPVTSGELLLEEFLKPMGLSQYRLVKEIGVPAPNMTLQPTAILAEVDIERADDEMDLK